MVDIDTLFQLRTASASDQVRPPSFETFSVPLSTAATILEASGDRATDLKLSKPTAALLVRVSPTGTRVSVGILALGASFNAATLIVTTAASEDRPPSEAVTEKVASPLSLAERAYFSCASSATVNT